MILKSTIARDRMNACPQMIYQVQDKDGNLSEKLSLCSSAEFTFGYNMLIRTDTNYWNKTLVNVNYVIGGTSKDA